MFLLALSALAGMAGAWKGNRVAWPLLAGLAVSCALRLAGTPFNPFASIFLDLVVILGIVAVWVWNLSEGLRTPRLRELAIVGSFAPIWSLYFAQPDGWVTVIELIVAAQLVSVFPFFRATFRARAWLASRAGYDPPLRMVKA